MNSWLALLIAAPIAAMASSCATVPPEQSPDLKAVLADPARPAVDVARDADRKPVELMTFAGVRPGMTIAELAPGGGYFTRVLTGAVGPNGKIYAIAGRPSPGFLELAPKRANLIVVTAQPGTLPLPQQVDLVWTTLNYHDFKNNNLENGDVAQALNAEAFRALKPGGVYLVVDHDTAPGAGATQTSTLHRIEGAQVQREVEEAGFRLDSSSDLLRHPADDHTAKVQETGTRGKTDQFVLKFRKTR